MFVPFALTRIFREKLSRRCIEECISGATCSHCQHIKRTSSNSRSLVRAQCSSESRTKHKTAYLLGDFFTSDHNTCHYTQLTVEECQRKWLFGRFRSSVRRGEKSRRSVMTQRLIGLLCRVLKSRTKESILLLRHFILERTVKR